LGLAGAEALLPVTTRLAGDFRVAEPDTSQAALTKTEVGQVRYAVNFFLRISKNKSWAPTPGIAPNVEARSVGQSLLTDLLGRKEGFGPTWLQEVGGGHFAESRPCSVPI
jgi:hypothetical protein